MDSKVSLLRELLENSEKYLIPMGVWPSATNTWITIFNIIVLFGFSVLILIKNLLQPERESIENAITLANGALASVVYFATMLVKKDKFMRFFDYIKADRGTVSSEEGKQMLIQGGREYRKISTALSYILPVAVLVRFVQPPIEFAYIQLFKDDKSFSLPPSMGIPTFLFGEILTYIMESLVRTVMLSTLIGICAIFVLSCLYICTQCNILASDLQNFSDNKDDTINKLIETHQAILCHAKLLNEMFSPFFFADCCFSYVNLSIMMFSLIASNVRIQNYLMEVPLVTVGISQLFFLLYFGDRLIDATSQISDAIYQSEWNSFSVGIQMKIQLIIMRGQKSQTLNAGGEHMMVASVLLFSQICQNAWGAFNILRTTVQR